MIILIVMQMTPCPILVQKICLLSLPNFKELPKLFSRWYEDNHMKTKPGKNHVLFNFSIQRVVLFDNVQIASSLSEKLLGITFDSELKFNISAKLAI